MDQGCLAVLLRILETSTRRYERGLRCFLAGTTRHHRAGAVESRLVPLPVLVSRINGQSFEKPSRGKRGNAPTRNKKRPIGQLPG